MITSEMQRARYRKMGRKEEELEPVSEMSEGRLVKIVTDGNRKDHQEDPREEKRDGYLKTIKSSKKLNAKRRKILKI